jgi:hypothetical protein
MILVLQFFNQYQIFVGVILIEVDDYQFRKRQSDNPLAMNCHLAMSVGQVLLV